MQKNRAAVRSGGNFIPARAGWTANSRKAKSVGELVPKLMQPAFEKFGFPAAAILTDWEAIAGSDIAAFTAPERLKWPRRVSNDDAESSKSGATLILRVAGARALDVEYLRPQLIARINAAFGYRAVCEIKLLQAPIPISKTERDKSVSKTMLTEHKVLTDLPAGALKDAFARIAAGMKARERRAETSSL
jgi:hypothetical protein